MNNRIASLTVVIATASLVPLAAHAEKNPDLLKIDFGRKVS